MTFRPLGNSDHFSVSIDFPVKFVTGCLFYHIVYGYSHADWDDLGDHLRDVPREDIFKLSASAAARQFCEWVQVVIDVYFPHREYKVEPQLSPLFSVASAAAIVHRNHLFFCLYQKDKSSDSKVKFRQTSNCCKRVCEAAKLEFANKTKHILHFKET